MNKMVTIKSTITRSESTIINNLTENVPVPTRSGTCCCCVKNDMIIAQNEKILNLIKPTRGHFTPVVIFFLIIRITYIINKFLKHSLPLEKME